MESIRQSPAYAPVGIILGAFAWFALKKISEHIPCVDAAQLRKTLLALIFSGAYACIWIEGSNPHDAEIKENAPIYEIPLLLAGGYYVLHIYPQRFPSTSAHHLFSIIAIICVIIQQKGASAANTFGFLVEAPNVFFALRGCVAKLECFALDIILNVIYPLLFILAKFLALGYHTYLIVDHDAPIHLKILTLILALFSIAFIIELVYLAYKGDEEPKKSSAYAYTWTQGSNPHDAEIKESTLQDEIPLLLAGGYYMLHIYPQRFPSTSTHHLISMIAISCVIIEQKGASAANTFGFLVEAPNVFFALRGCIAKLECFALDIILNVIYPMIFVLAKFAALGYHTYLIVNQSVPMHIKVLTVILALFSLAFVLEIAYLALNGDEESNKGRSKSRSGSKSRSKSRTRSKPNNRRSRCCQR